MEKNYNKPLQMESQADEQFSEEDEFPANDIFLHQSSIDYLGSDRLADIRGTSVIKGGSPPSWDGESGGYSSLTYSRFHN